MAKKPKIVIVCGPTGIGKTRVAIDLATRFGGEIVGADSMQIYRRMDIGTAKPTPAERAAVPHHLVDLIEPDEAFDARQYAAMARERVRQLVRNDRTPFVVGGTGLYIKALLYGLFDTRPPDPAMRARLQSEARERGSAHLHRRLQACDPEAAARIHPNDTYRLIRAIEVFAAEGEPLSARQRAHGFEQAAFEALKIGLHMERAVLNARIDRRVDAMLVEGLLDEVKALLAAGYHGKLKAMQSLGYRHLVAFLEGRMNWETAVQTMKRDTRRYAKRQMTWFKADPQVVWTTPQAAEATVPLIAAFLRGAARRPEEVDG